MNETWTKKLSDAIAPLTWGFEEGDDGSLITLALDEAASVLQQLPQFSDVSAASLSELLRKSDMLDVLDDLGPLYLLYVLGERHNYGAGLTEAAAAEATVVAEEVCILLDKVVELVNSGNSQ